MSKYSSFKEQQLLTESWRNYLVEQQPVGANIQQPQQAQQAQQAQQPQQAQQAQAQPELDVRRPADIKKMLAAKITQKSGNPGPDEITKQNIKKNNKFLSVARSAAQPLQAAQISLQIFSQLSPEDQAEVAKAVQLILQTKPQQKTNKSLQKESLIEESIVVSALQTLGGGDITKGLQRLGTGAFIGSLAFALAQIASGDYAEGGAAAIKTIVNNMEKLYTSNNIGDLSKILGTVIDTVIQESIYEHAHLEDGTPVCPACLEELLEGERKVIQEAKYHGRTVTLNKPMKGDVKKSKVYVKDPKTGNIKKVNFGDPNMTIKKNIPARRKSFRARHKCDQKKDKTTAGFWSCKAWE